MAGFTYVVLFLIAGVNAVIGTFVLLRNNGNAVHRAFFVFAIGIAFWSASIGMIFLTKNFLFNLVIFSSAAVMLGGLLCFARVFPEGRMPAARFWFAFVPLLLLIGGAYGGLFVRGITVSAQGNIQPVNGPFMPLAALLVGSYVLASVFLFIRSYRREIGIGRQRIQYFLFGLSGFALSVLVFDALLPAAHQFQFNAFGPLSSLLVTGVTAYAIVRHQLMDIRIVIQRSALYSLLALVAILFYLTLIFFFSLLFRYATNTTAMPVALLTILIGIYSGPWLERRFRQWTDPIFFRGQYRFSDAVSETVAILNRNLDLGELVRAFSEALERILRTEHVCILLSSKRLFFDSRRALPGVTQYSFDVLISAVKERSVIMRRPADMGFATRGEDSVEERMFQKIHEFGIDGDTEVIVPIFLEQRPLGILLLGRKRSGDAFTREDLVFLKTISFQFAAALAKAELYEKVQEHSRELEAKVARRTAEVRRLYEMQTRLIRDLSHALQTPLTVMKAEFESLKLGSSSGGKKVGAAERSIDEASRLIADLIDLARLASVHDELEKKEIDMSRALQEVVEYFTVVAKEQGIEVTSAIEPGIIILGDRRRIEEVIASLLSNAVKYMGGTKEQRITIRLEKNVGSIMLHIQDTGQGIPDEDIRFIFDPFYRSMSARASHARGSGLGLAICKHIVEKHGGKIEVRSKTGEGTVFTVQFPQAESNRNPQD